MNWCCPADNTKVCSESTSTLTVLLPAGSVALMWFPLHVALGFPASIKLTANIKILRQYASITMY